MRDPSCALAVVAQLGLRLEHAPHGWRDTKALILLAAWEAGDWQVAAALADALGVPVDLQEQAWRDYRRWCRARDEAA